MISAEEARKMLIENAKSKTNEELKNIENEIEMAISNNKSSVTVEPTVSPETQIILKKLGYSIENHFYFNETYTIIKW